MSPEMEQRQPCPRGAPTPGRPVGTGPRLLGGPVGSDSLLQEALWGRGSPHLDDVRGPALHSRAAPAAPSPVAHRQVGPQCSSVLLAGEGTMALVQRRVRLPREAAAEVAQEAGLKVCPHAVHVHQHPHGL